MLVLIKSAPDTDEAKRGLQVAADASADLVLMQNAVRMAAGAGGFTGNVYVIEEDLKLRGLGDVAGGASVIGYDELVDMMAGGGKVLGMF